MAEMHVSYCECLLGNNKRLRINWILDFDPPCAWTRPRLGPLTKNDIGVDEPMSGLAQVLYFWKGAVHSWAFRFRTLRRLFSPHASHLRLCVSRHNSVPV